MNLESSHIGSFRFVNQHHPYHIIIIQRLVTCIGSTEQQSISHFIVYKLQHARGVSKESKTVMAGTRLAIQTLVIVQLLFVVLVSVHHGFCRTSCQRGNLTKDLPLVPGLVPINSNGAVIQAQWWEDALCNPITALSDAFMGDSGGIGDRTTSATGDSDDEDDVRISVTTWSEKLEMNLVVENATQLPHWIEIVSSGLNEIDEIDDEDSVTSFESLLSFNPMGLKIIPPSLLEKDKATVTSIWSHYKKHGSKRKPSEQPQERMVVYIPSWMSIHEKTIGWKAFDVSSTDEKSSTTMILPQATEPETENPSLGQLQPLVEDWMARSILARQEWKRRKSHNDVSNSTHKTRLTREFPIEHFMAVLMPLLFPLMLPFLISLIKEYKRYKELTASKKEKTEQSNASSQILETPAPLKTTTE